MKYFGRLIANDMKNARINAKPIVLVNEAKEIIKAINNRFLEYVLSSLARINDPYMKHIKRNSLHSPCDNNKVIGKKAIMQGVVIAAALDSLTAYVKYPIIIKENNRNAIVTLDARVKLLESAPKIANERGYKGGKRLAFCI